jgi:hypothetical protein
MKPLIDSRKTAVEATIDAFHAAMEKAKAELKNIMVSSRAAAEVPPAVPPVQ